MATFLSYHDALVVDHYYETVAVNLNAAHAPKNVNCDRISIVESQPY